MNSKVSQNMYAISNMKTSDGNSATIVEINNL